MDWENRTVSLLLCLSILLATIHNGNAERKIVCYYTNWSIYRPGTAKFSPQNINPYLCTHLIYAFGGFTKDNALKPFDKYQDIEKGGYAKFTGLKTYNKNLKTLLAIGGWNEGSSRFSPMVADPDRRREFVKNAIKFLRKNHFDGLDLDWEYPAFRDGGKPRDKDNYASLVQELREEFERESSKTGRPRLLLTLAMPAGIEYIDKGYDIPRLNEYLDFINLLSYDYHSSYEPAVDHHSPLYPLEEDNEYNYDTELTIDYTVNYLLKKGASPGKIILGIPTYGRSYTLFNEDATDLGSPADGPGVEGDATREKGYLAYYEICESLAQSDEWQVVQPNAKAMGPYAYKGDQWVGYDDEDIVKLKAKYANEKNLGGIMFWTIDNDDFRGKCHDRPYPLIEAAKEMLLTDNSNTVQKSKTVDNRKKPRAQGVQSNTVRRKGGRRSTTTAAPAPKIRASSSRPKYRTFSRPKTSEEEEEDQRVDRRSYDSSSDEEDSSERGNTVKTANKNERPSNKNKRRSSKDRSSSNRNRRKQARRKEETNSNSNERSLSNKLTTPEPPTTPDPGTDFKCEDEGFFPHPRDCKKYFWCLESGPGGLGVVAHQFTCPSGLVFNKAADSCDYPRNVVCPKSKTSQSSASTTRAPITAATSRTTYLYSTTRRPSPEKPDTEEEYEYYDEDDDEVEEEDEEEGEEEEPKTTTTPKALLYKTITRNKPSTTTTTSTTEAPTTTSKVGKNEPEITNIEDEEDPRVIKELIMLIKKAGGIEQLEKQLLLQDKNADNSANSGSVNATPATISRTLYERVLNRQAGKVTNKQRTSTNTNYANGPGSAQFEGLDEVPEVKSLRRSQKPQYVTIERPKPSTKEPPIEDEQLDEEEDLDEDNTDVASSEEQTISNPFLASSTQRATPNYINIRRARPSTSRYENDVEEKNKNTEEEAPIPSRRRRPSVFPKNTETSSSENTRDQESRSSANEESPQTTKSRYVSVQRFRSTTSHSTEVVSQVASTSQEPITESVSSEATEIDQKVDTTTATSPVINILPSIGLSSTPNDILVESETEKPIPTTTPEASSTTTESVKLVEDSATEILLTTAPANLSTLSVPNTRINTASVSQPRPFSFNRRNRPTTEPTTTPLPPSNDQTRSKVSISSRNQTRSSFLVGRDRLRPRQENAGRNEPTTENEQIESSRGGVVKETAHTRGRSKSRGVSRYTPPTFRVRNEDSSNSVVRERIRTTEPPVSTAIVTDASRTRFRRPIAKTTTESTKANELEDSPIVRIAQGYPRRSLSSRSKNTVKDEIDNDKITNIKVFKKPTALNRDVYARTRYTRKRNNVEIGEFKKETEEKTSEAAPDFFYSSTSTTTTDSIVDRSLNDTTIPIIITTTERPIVNSIDETDKVLSPTTISPETQETTITGLDTETNTVEAVRTTELTIENEVNTETDDRVDASEGLDQVLTTTDSAIKLQDFEPNVIIVLPANNTETVNEENINLAVPRRRKVLLRRRPVTSSTTATSQAEQEENKLIPRRRKVIKRVRPVQSTVSTVDADSSTEKDQILLRFRSTTPREDATSTIVAETSDVSTENFGLSTTETVTAETIDLDITDGFTGVTLETSTAETAISDTGFSESDVVTMASTIIDNVTAVVVDSTTSKEEWTVETGATESTTSSNFLINFTDANDISDETLPSRNELDALPTTISQLTTPSAAFQSNRRLETYNRTYYLDSRYVRKKFVRRRPVASSSSSSENVTNDWYPNIETSSHVPLTSERNEVGLSKRRKSLFVRRRPVSSTTARTTGFIEEDFIDENKFGDEKELQLEVRRNVENATPRINRAYDETFYPITPSAARESEEFWNRYTTPSTSERRSPFPVTVQSETTLDKSSANVDESSENEESHRSVSFNNRSPEIRPRYRVPESLKKTASVEGLYSLDSLPEESGESNNHKSRYQNFRQPRTRYKYREITRNQREENEESLADATHSPSFDSSTQVRTRFYARRPVPSTEPPVTETLIPAKKFDYVADAYRRQQSLRTTPRNQNEEADSTTWTSLNEERAEVQNFVDGDYVTTPSSQPLVTRLVTSVEESATTERQKILIKTKYSSLTSNTKIPLQITIARLEHPATTASPISDTLERSTDSLDESEGNEDESVNEIRQGQVERSTLPIEGEFLHQARFTTESHESSTIEIESVFNNLIGSRDSTK
ncbi:mucin-4 [Bombus impatiens]|uniref:chitinase n=1 Tax=Bombus impatiens TaxID=132113 RepID=A0A6P6FAH5_BOMIM|nr:mucin-4 [Bombus impatiens]